MKKQFLFLALVILSSFSMKQQKEKIVFFGDSITQAGAREGGFITLMQETLMQKNLSNQYELIGAGIGGNKVYDLYLRMEDDVLAKDPSTVVIWIGVNDVWHKRLTGTGTDQDKFERFYDAIIKKLQDRHIKVILCTPATIGEKTDFSNEQDGDLNQYAKIVRQIAAKHGCPLVDFRQIFLDYDRTHNPDNLSKGILTVDGVHLNATGNRLVADTLFQTLIHS